MAGRCFRYPPARMAELPEPKLKLVSEKASSSIARVIRDAILDGTFEPGRPLREEELAKWLDISRTPIREALLILESEGLVTSVRNRGTRVTEFDAGSLEEVYSIRAVLEGYAARKAAANITEEEIQELRDSCSRFEKLTSDEEDFVELVAENMRFHSMIQQAARSDRLKRMITGITAVPLIYRSYMSYSRSNRVKVLADHYAILEALENHDVAAASERMEGHVEWARDVAVAHLLDTKAENERRS